MNYEIEKWRKYYHAIAIQIGSIKGSLTSACTELEEVVVLNLASL